MIIDFEGKGTNKPPNYQNNSGFYSFSKQLITLQGLHPKLILKIGRYFLSLQKIIAYEIFYCL